MTTLDKIKNWFVGALAVISAILVFLLRREKDKTETAKAELGKAVFKNETQENDKDYEDAKTRANRLVTEYQSARSTDSTD